MSRVALVVVAAALVLGGCGDDDGSISADTTAPRPATPSTTTSTSTTTTTTTTRETPGDTSPWTLTARPLDEAPDAPPLVISDGRGIARVDGSAVTPVDGAPAAVGWALADGAGGIVAEVLDGAGDGDGDPRAIGLVRIADGTSTPVPLDDEAHEVALHDLVVVDGSLHVLYAWFADREQVDREVTGELVLHDLGSGNVIALADAAAPELFLADAAVGGGVVVLSFYSDLTETVSFVDLAGRPVDRPSPTDDLEYNQPPLVTGAVLSPDGSELAHLEGPDIDGRGDPAEPVGDWEVVVRDADGEQLRLTVADRTLVEVRLDFDGRWVVLSGRDDDGWVAPLVIDTESTDLPAHVVDDRPGRASLERVATGSTP